MPVCFSFQLFCSVGRIKMLEYQGRINTYIWEMQPGNIPSSLALPLLRFTKYWKLYRVMIPQVLNGCGTHITSHTQIYLRASQKLYTHGSVST